MVAHATGPPSNAGHLEGDDSSDLHDSEALALSERDDDSLPSVSVVIPTRNRPEFLTRAIRAVLEQRYDGDIECCVVFDQTEPVAIPVPAGPGRSLRSIANGRTPGLAGARNTGTLQVSGEYVAQCDDDDVWHPDKLRLQLQALRSQPGAVAAGCGIRVRYRSSSTVRIPATRLVTFEQLLSGRVAELHSSTLLARRGNFLDRIGLIDETLPGSYGEDYDWLLRAARVGPLVTVPRALVDVHWHPQSHFEGRWRMVAAALTALLERNPEFAGVPRGRARIEGQVAFAVAASGAPRDAWPWIRRAFSGNRMEPRVYLAIAVMLGLPPTVIMHVLHRFGRGI